MVPTVHQTWGRERNFPSRRAGCLPACPLASALCWLERLICSPLYRKLSSSPDTFLLPSRASDLHWTFLSCLSTGAIIYLSPLSCKHSFLLVKGSWTSPQMFCLMPKSLSRREKASKTMQLAKEKFITDSSQGFCRIHRRGAGSESPEPQLLPKFIR